MNNIGEQIVVVLTGVIGVAALAVILAPRSNTAKVIQSAGQAFSGALGVAVSPVTGGGSPVASLGGNW